jgi:hypothetical protein
MASEVRARHLFLPILAGVLGVVVVGLAVGFATGFFHVRQGVGAYEVNRDEGVEKLFPGREAVYVYRFRGGLPRCWAQVDRPTGVEVAAIDPMLAAVQGSPPRSPPDEAEGIIALVGPAAKGDAYTLRLVVTKLSFPEGRRPHGTPRGVGYGADLKPGGTRLPDRPGSETLFLSRRVSPELQPGHDVELVDGVVTTMGGEKERVKVWLRFYTPDELASADEPTPGPIHGR